MKMLFLLIATAVVAIVAYRNMAPPSEYSPEVVRFKAIVPTVGQVRRFDVKLVRMFSTSSALATGEFYDVDPEVTLSPEFVQSARGKVDELMITGLPVGHRQGDRWVGWLLRTGSASYTSPSGPRHVPKYEVTVPKASKPGGWMWLEGRTQLDRRGKSQ